VLVLVVAAAGAGRSAHARLVRWDAQWYAGIAADGYGFTRLHPDGRRLSDLAFFPLYPAAERAVATLTGLRLVDAGLLVSAVASLVAAAGLYLVGARLSGPRAGVLLVLLWAALPVGIVASMAYSEALFTALAAWALLAVLDRRWLTAAVLASAAGLTRPVGIAVAAAVVTAAVLAFGDRSQPRARLAVAALVAPAGWLAYLGWVALRTGDPWGYFRVAGRWGNGFDGGAAFGRWVWVLLSGPRPWLGLFVVLGLGALIGLYLLAVRDRQPPALLVFAGLLLVLAVTTSGYFGSKPRYLLPAFPLLLPVAVRLAGLRTGARVGVLILLTAGSAAYGAVWLLGPGPP
jgi:hypothetical protein